jgi:hypothetical protein
MSHACSAFAVAAFVAVWSCVRERWSAGGLVALGALAGLMAMVREQDAFFATGPLVDFAVAWWKRPGAAGAGPSRSRLLGHALLGLVAAAVVYLPQALSYLALNGYPGPSRLVARKMTWSSPHLLEVLFSASHGFFVWTPLALLAIVAVVAVAAGATRQWPHRATRWFAGCLLLMFVTQVYVAGSVESWTVAGAFGQRRFVAVTAILVFGVAAAWRLAATRAARVVLAAVLALGVWWNVGLIVQFGTGRMDRQRLEPARNAYVTFVELPFELPSLAYRYFFERDTFYKGHGRVY